MSNLTSAGKIFVGSRQSRKELKGAPLILHKHNKISWLYYLSILNVDGALLSYDSMDDDRGEQKALQLP